MGEALDLGRHEQPPGDVVQRQVDPSTRGPPNEDFGMVSPARLVEQGDDRPRDRRLMAIRIGDPVFG
jgi:hypothetical protein